MPLLRKKIIDMALEVIRGYGEKGIHLRQLYATMFSRYGITRKTFNMILQDMKYAYMVEVDGNDQVRIRKLS